MADEIIPQLGKRIRHFRRKQRLSQEEVAHRVGTTQSYLGKIERGTVVVGVEMLLKISDALEVDIVHLFQRHEFPEELLEYKICEMVKKATPSERRLILHIVDAVVN